MADPDPKTKLSKIAARLSDIEDITSPHLRAILYGSSGVGKTILAFQMLQETVPAGKGILLVDSGTSSDVLKNAEWAHLRERVKVLKYTDLDDLLLVVQALQISYGEFANIGGVIVDEGSTIHQKDLFYVVGQNVKRRPSKDPDIPDSDDYQAEQNRYARFANQLWAIPGNVIITSHERQTKRNDLDVIDLDFQPKLSGLVKNAANLVARLTAKPEKRSSGDAAKYLRRAQVHPTSIVSAKTRISGLPLELDTATLLEAVVEYVSGKRPTSTEEVTVVSTDEYDVNSDDIVRYEG
jgi:G:T/U-mismatch repair DNA glycosylase